MALVTWNAAIVLSFSPSELSIEALLAMSGKIRTTVIDLIEMIPPSMSPTYRPLNQSSRTIKLMFEASIDLVDKPTKENLDTPALNIQLTGIDEIDDSIGITGEILSGTFPLAIPFVAHQEVISPATSSTDTPLNEQELMTRLGQFLLDPGFQYLSQHSIFSAAPVAEQDADIDVEALQAAMLDSDIGAIRSILTARPGLVDKPIFFGDTLLTQAVTARNEPVIHVLIECGADPLKLKDPEHVNFALEIMTANSESSSAGASTSYS